MERVVAVPMGDVAVAAEVLRPKVVTMDAERRAEVVAAGDAVVADAGANARLAPSVKGRDMREDSALTRQQSGF